MDKCRADFKLCIMAVSQGLEDRGPRTYLLLPLVCVIHKRRHLVQYIQYYNENLWKISRLFKDSCYLKI